MALVTNVSVQLIVLFLVQQAVTSITDVNRSSPSADTSPLVDDDVMTAVALATKAAQADLGYHGNRVASGSSEARLNGMLNMARQLLRLAKEDEEEDAQGMLGYGRADVVSPGRPFRRPDVRSMVFGRRLEPEDKQQDSKVIMKAMRYGRK